MKPLLKSNSRPLRTAVQFALAALLLSSTSRAETDFDDLISEGGSLPQSKLNLMMMDSYRSVEGRFDAYGSYHGLADGSSSQTLVNTLGGSYRFTQEWEMALAFSIIDQEADTSSSSSNTFSVGTPNLEVRYHIRPPGSQDHISLHLGVQLPFKSTSQQQSTAATSDASSTTDNGTGFTPVSAYAIKAGVMNSARIEPLHLRFAVDLSTTYSFAAPTDLPDAPPGSAPVNVQTGQQYSLAEHFSYVFNSLWSGNVGMRQVWVGDTYADGQDMPNTASRLFTTDAGVVLSISKTVRMTATYATPFPFYAYAVNQPYAPTISFGLSYGGI